MNAKKICALALSLGLSASFAPKGDAGLIKDAAKVAGVYASYKAADILIPKYGPSYSQWWQLTKTKGGDFVILIKGYIGMGVDAAIKFAEEKFELEKKFGKENKYAGIGNEGIDDKRDVYAYGDDEDFVNEVNNEEKE